MRNTSDLSRRVIMRIELLPQAKERFLDYGDALGMTQVAVSSRLVEWLSKQNDVVQAAVLGLYPKDIRAEIPSLILKSLATEKRP